MKIYKQRIVGKFIVDFYCASARLVIEVDGSQHYETQGLAYDAERSQFLISLGLEILRFSNRDIDTRRSLFQRLFGVGTITVLSSDRTTPTLVLKNVKNPLFVKELIHKQVEEMKLKRRVRYGEIATTCDHDDDDDLDDR